MCFWDRKDETMGEGWGHVASGHNGIEYYSQASGHNGIEYYNQASGHNGIECYIQVFHK